MRQRQLENRDRLSFTLSVAHRDDVFPIAVTSIFLTLTIVPSTTVSNGSGEVLLDGGVKSHGLLGFVVHIDDGFLNHCVEATRRDQLGVRLSSVPCDLGCRASSRLLPPALGCSSDAVRPLEVCSEAPGRQSLFQGLSTPQCSWGPGKASPVMGEQRLSPRVGHAKYGMIGRKMPAPPLRPMVGLAIRCGS